MWHFAGWAQESIAFQGWSSLLTFVGLVAFMVATKLAFVALRLKVPIPSQDLALSWPFIALIAAMGLIGLAASPRVGIPGFWEVDVSWWERFVIPTGLGLAYGLGMVVRDLSDPAPVHLRGAFAPAFYAYGAIFLETFLRLFTISVVMWLATILVGPAATEPAFWVAAVLASLYEPWPHVIAAVGAARGVGRVWAVLGQLVEPLFWTNLLQGYLFWRYGFVAALVFRLAAYLVWHAIYGAWLSRAQRI